MRVTSLNGAELERRLDASITGLHDATPELSAHRILTKGQRNALVGAGVVLVFGAALNVVDSLIAVLSILTAFYISITINRAVLFVRSGRSESVLQVTDDEAKSVSDDQLPTYTLLIPAYREPEVISTLLEHVERLDYPREKLDVKLLLEADDADTLRAVADINPAEYVEVVLVPPAQPRTKPKACNYGLALARGDLVTIYDAEDEPEVLQLRRAVVALDRCGPETVCVQAKLSFSNFEQNLITRWFTLEYAMWFSQLLPGLVALGAPLPLGGTSNHFRKAALDELGGWDPFNVTEDADLGIRLARRGYRCGVLESTTLEEANSDLVNWVKQRSRWYKGYLQTTLVHFRHPITLYRQLGAMGFAQLVLFVLGTPLLAVLNPLFWSLTALWFIGHPHFIRQLFPAGLYYPAVLCWVFGNLLVCYLTVITVRITRRYELLWAALLVPIYWVMMAAAAIKAFWQLIATPSFWEKTVHGLTRTPAPPETPPAEATV